MGEIKDEIEKLYREKIKERNRVAYEKNKEQRLVYQRRYSKEHREEINKRNREKRSSRTPEEKEKYRILYKKYALVGREEKRVREMKRRQESKKALFQYLGASCKRCGFSDYRALQIDHVSGGGVRERRLYGAPSPKRLLIYVKQMPEKYQLLCANCNWIKRYENDENSKNRNSLDNQVKAHNIY